MIRFHFKEKKWKISLEKFFNKIEKFHVKQHVVLRYRIFKPKW